MRIRLLSLVLCIVLAGCNTPRTARYGSPGCCGGPPPDVRLRPLPTAPPPVALPPAPPPVSIPNDPLKGDGPGPGPTVRLGPPRVREESKPPPLADIPGPKDKDDAAPLPIELPGFAAALPRVASGLRPFPDGIDWLKARGYKAALHLRAPGEDSTAARRQFEMRGLSYLPLEVSATTLTREAYEDFVRAVEAEATLPLFVYDRDGSMAGGLWYLYFRFHKKETDEKAKAEAARLGLRADDEDHKTTWLAVQALAAKLK